MKNHILASIALFGIYRNKNYDTYNLIAQYISAVIAHKEYDTFTPTIIKEDLLELYGICIPTGVIKSVVKNRIEDIQLKDGAFRCSKIPKDKIDKEYSELTKEYGELFEELLKYVRQFNKETNLLSDDYIVNVFSDYLINGYSSESKLDRHFAAFVAGAMDNVNLHQKIDLLSSGLISYKGLSYADSLGTGSWTDKLTIYLDTEFLFSCAGYNGTYYKMVFDELYELIKEVNVLHRKRTRKEEDIITLKYFKDTREVYTSIFNLVKSLINSNAVPDPSRKAIVKLVNESVSEFDVDIQKAQIDSIVKDNYHILYDDNDYDKFIVDPRYVLFDDSALQSLNEKYNSCDDDVIKRKIDYISRILTIINGLRGNASEKVFEKCRYVFLTGSHIGHGASISVRGEDKYVGLATDVDFLVSRLWFRLNKPLSNNRIPVSLDLIARAQAVLTRDVTQKIRMMYEDLVKKNLTDTDKQNLYAILKDADGFLEPYNNTSLEDVLTFIERTNLDDLIEQHHQLKKKAETVQTVTDELMLTKGELTKTKFVVQELKRKVDEENSKTAELVANNNHKDKMIRCLSIVVSILVIGLILLLWVK